MRRDHDAGRRYGGRRDRDSAAKGSGSGACRALPTELAKTADFPDDEAHARAQELRFGGAEAVVTLNGCFPLGADPNRFGTGAIRILIHMDEENPCLRSDREGDS